MDNEELAERLSATRRGDKRAFDAVYQELRKPVFTIIYRIARDQAASEDILQEAFLRLYRLPEEPSIRNTRAYFFQVARNLALDSLRGGSVPASLDETEELAVGGEDVAGRLDVERALSALSAEENQIVTLRVNAGLKFREIAAMLDLPLGTALWKYRRAIGKLRDILSEGGAR